MLKDNLGSQIVDVFVAKKELTIMEHYAKNFIGYVTLLAFDPLFALIALKMCPFSYLGILWRIMVCNIVWFLLVPIVAKILEKKNIGKYTKYFLIEYVPLFIFGLLLYTMVLLKSFLGAILLSAWATITMYVFLDWLKQRISDYWPDKKSKETEAKVEDVKKLCDS